MKISLTDYGDERSGRPSISEGDEVWGRTTSFLLPGPLISSRGEWRTGRTPSKRILRLGSRSRTAMEQSDYCTVIKFPQQRNSSLARRTTSKLSHHASPSFPSHQYRPLHGNNHPSHLYNGIQPRVYPKPSFTNRTHSLPPAPPAFTHPRKSLHTQHTAHPTAQSMSLPLLSLSVHFMTNAAPRP